MYATVGFGLGSYFHLPLLDIQKVFGDRTNSNCIRLGQCEKTVTMQIGDGPETPFPSGGELIKFIMSLPV